MGLSLFLGFSFLLFKLLLSSDLHRRENVVKMFNVVKFLPRSSLNLSPKSYSVSLSHLQLIFDLPLCCFQSSSLIPNLSHFVSSAFSYSSGIFFLLLYISRFLSLATSRSLLFSISVSFSLEFCCPPISRQSFVSSLFSLLAFRISSPRLLHFLFFLRIPYSSFHSTFLSLPHTQTRS